MSEKIDIVVQPWYIKHGKQIIVVASILFGLWLIGSKIYNAGKDSADKAWLSVYNKSVENYNARIELLSKESKVLSEKLAVAEKRIADGVNDAADEVNKESERETQNGNRGADCQITVNSKMPQSVLDAWTAMNQAAATQINTKK